MVRVPALWLIALVLSVSAITLPPAVDVYKRQSLVRTFRRFVRCGTPLQGRELKRWNARKKSVLHLSLIHISQQPSMPVFPLKTAASPKRWMSSQIRLRFARDRKSVV